MEVDGSFTAETLYLRAVIPRAELDLSGSEPKIVGSPASGSVICRLSHCGRTTMSASVCEFWGLRRLGEEPRIESEGPHAKGPKSSLCSWLSLVSVLLHEFHVEIFSNFICPFQSLMELLTPVSPSHTSGHPGIGMTE